MYRSLFQKSSFFGAHLPSVRHAVDWRDHGGFDFDFHCKPVVKVCLPKPPAHTSDCKAVVVDFNQFNAGDKVSSISVLDGALTIAVHGDENGENGPAKAGDNDAMIFDAEQTTAPISGGDDDLLAPGHGKILIITEDDKAANPDDSNKGGQFYFDFSKAVNLTSLDVIDADEAGGSITVYDALGNEIGSAVIPTTGDGELQEILAHPVRQRLAAQGRSGRLRRH